MAKNTRHSELVSENNKGGESLPLARTSSLATPSSGGHPRNAPVDTLIEAPYVLPEGWKWERLGNYISLLRGVSYKKEVAHSEKLKNDCLIMRGGNIVEGSINLESDNIYVDKSLVSENQLIKKNDIIIVTSTGSTKVIGRAGVSKNNYKDVAFGAFLTLARPNDLANKSYINHYFQSSLYRERIRQLASGVNINNSRTDYITETPIPLPPTLTEQQRIVNRIESMFAKLDQAQEKAQAVLDSFETHKAAILHKAFTGELTANWRKENSVLDNSWETKALKDTTLKIIDGDRGKNYPSKSDFSEIGYCVFLNTKNVTKNGFSFEKVDFITKEKDESLHNGKLERGDVIFTTRGTIGNSAIYSDDIPYEHLRINSGMVIFREGTELNKHFLLLLFKSKNVQTQINKLQTGSAQPQLPIKVMKNLQIPIPSIPEQNEIVKILVSILEKESRAKEAAQTVLDQIALQKKSILARAFRGEL